MLTPTVLRKALGLVLAITMLIFAVKFQAGDVVKGLSILWVFAVVVYVPLMSKYEPYISAADTSGWIAVGAVLGLVVLHFLPLLGFAYTSKSPQFLFPLVNPCLGTFYSALMTELYFQEKRAPK